MTSFVRRVPEGDNRERMVCAQCGYVAYENPKVIVGAVVVLGDAILMCRRAIEPRKGYWTLPAGYLELGETLEEGAAREAQEEANANIRLDGILGVFSIARIGQVQVIFQARFADSGEPRFRRPGEPGGELVFVGSYSVERYRVSLGPLGPACLAAARRRATRRPRAKPGKRPARHAPDGAAQRQHGGWFVIRLCVALMACLPANPALAASPAPQRSAHLPLPVPPVPPGTPPANENAPVPDVAMRGPLDPEFRRAGRAPGVSSDVARHGRGLLARLPLPDE